MCHRVVAYLEDAVKVYVYLILGFNKLIDGGDSVDYYPRVFNEF